MRHMKLLTVALLAACAAAPAAPEVRARLTRPCGCGGEEMRFPQGWYCERCKTYVEDGQ